MLIEHACRDLVLHAAMYADRSDSAALARLFTSDAELVRPNAQPLRGGEAIEASYAQRPAERITRHLVTNTVVDVVSPERATATSYVLLWIGSTADPATAHGRPAQRQQVGEFVDNFALTGDGWRIARREARFVLLAGT
jgi:ketosteroid isomerase-like protein